MLCLFPSRWSSAALSKEHPGNNSQSYLFEDKPTWHKSVVMAEHQGQAELAGLPQMSSIEVPNPLGDKAGSAAKKSLNESAVSTGWVLEQHRSFRPEDLACSQVHAASAGRRKPTEPHQLQLPGRQATGRPPTISPDHMGASTAATTHLVRSQDTRARHSGSEASQAGH